MNRLTFIDYELPKNLIGLLHYLLAMCSNYIASYRRREVPETESEIEPLCSLCLISTAALHSRSISSPRPQPYLVNRLTFIDCELLKKNLIGLLHYLLAMRVCAQTI